MNVTRVQTPYFTDTRQRGRSIRGIVLHDTETTGTVAPTASGSWHYDIDRSGAIVQRMDEADCAWHVRATDRWHPEWLGTDQPWPASIANCHTIGIELVSSGYWRSMKQPYSEAQYASLRALLADLFARRGVLPVVGHGQLQADRSDPVELDWTRLEGDDDMALTPEQQTILDAAARQTAAGNTIADGGDLDWWIGTWKQLASDKESLAQLLTKSQGETAARDAEVARLQSLLAAPLPAPVDVVDAVEVRFSGGTVALLTR